MARILYVYAQESATDSQMCQELEGWLYTLYRQANHTTTWHIIPPGHEIHTERQRHFQEADLILLLISVDFVKSEQCYNELQEAMRHRTRGASVVPILLRPVVDLSQLLISALQILPRNQEPVSKWKDRDMCWQMISQEIRKILENKPPEQKQNDYSDSKHKNKHSSQADDENETIRIGKYKLGNMVAQGGMSSIYEASHDIVNIRLAPAYPVFPQPPSQGGVSRWSPSRS